MATYNPAKNVWENEGGYTDWSAFDPAAAAAAGMSPMEIMNMAQLAGLGTNGPVFGGQNNIPSQAARDFFSGSYFKSLDPATQQQLQQTYKASHSDNGLGAFLTALAIPAAVTMGIPALASGGQNYGLGSALAANAASAVPAATVAAPAAGTAAAAAPGLSPVGAAAAGMDFGTPAGMLQAAGAPSLAATAAAPIAGVDTGAAALAAGGAASGLPGSGGATANTGSAVTPSTGGNAQSALSKVLSGNGTASDYLTLAGQAAPAIFGAVASSAQKNAYQDAANQALAYGAPSRARFEASFAPGFSMTNDPGYQDALDQVTKAMLHKLSVTGNPAGSPNAMEQILRDVNSQFAYPALQAYRSMNAGQGGISTLTSAAPGLTNAAINQGSNVYNSLGAGVADIFNPPSSLEESLKLLKAYGLK